MILVTGATGSVGRAAVRRLLAEGRQVRGLVRDTEAAAALEASGASALVGDVTRATDRAGALIGVDTVVACHSAYHRYDQLRIMAVDGEATEALIGDAAAAGVTHFTLLSHLHCDVDSPSQRFSAKLRAERALQAQDRMAFTILRLPPLFESLLHLPGLGDFGDRHSLLEFGDGQRRFTPMAADDVAQMAIAARQRPEVWGRVLSVGGPETYTWRELAGLLEQVWDENVTCWRLPLFVLTLMRAVLGLLRPTAGDRLAYLEALYRHDFTADPSEAAAIFGIGLDDLVGWLRRGGEPPAAPPDLSQERPPARSVEPVTAILDDGEAEPDYPSRAPEPVVELDDDRIDLDDEPPVREPLPQLELPPVREPEPEPEPEQVAEIEPEPEPAHDFVIPQLDSEPEPELAEEDEAPEPEPGAVPEPAVEEPVLDLDRVVTTPVDEPEAIELVAPEPEPEPEPEPVEEPASEVWDLDEELAAVDEAEAAIEESEPAPAFDVEALEPDVDLVAEPEPVAEVIEPEPVVEVMEPEPQALVEEPEPTLESPEADEPVLGHHAEFGIEPPVAPEPESRPPVRRPTAVDGPVVDADPE